MATYQIDGPDGKTYEIDGPEGATREQVIAVIQRRLAKQAEQAGFGQSFKDTALTLPSSGIEAAKFAATNSPEARKALIESQQPTGARMSWEEVKDLPSFIDWTEQLAGSSLGYLAAPAAVSTAAKLMTQAPGAAKLAGYGTLAAQYLVNNLGRQAQAQDTNEEAGRPTQPASVGRAAIAAAAQTGLDVAGFEFFKPAFRVFPFLRNLVGAEGVDAAAKSAGVLADAVASKSLQISGGIAKGIGKGIAFEVPQEVAQQALERWSAGLPLTDDDARREYYESAAGAALLGGGLGGFAGGVETHLENKQEIADKEAELAQARKQAAQDQLARKKQADITERVHISPTDTPEQIEAKKQAAQKSNEEYIGSLHSALDSLASDNGELPTEPLKKARELLGLPQSDMRKLRSAYEILVSRNVIEKDTKTGVRTLKQRYQPKEAQDVGIQQPDAGNIAPPDSGAGSAGTEVLARPETSDRATIDGTQPSGVVTPEPTAGNAPAGTEGVQPPLVDKRTRFDKLKEAGKKETDLYFTLQKNPVLDPAAIQNQIDEVKNTGDADKILATINQLTEQVNQAVAQQASTTQTQAVAPEVAPEPKKRGRKKQAVAPEQQAAPTQPVAASVVTEPTATVTSPQETQPETKSEEAPPEEPRQPASDVVNSLQTLKDLANFLPEKYHKPLVKLANEIAQLPGREVPPELADRVDYYVENAERLKANATPASKLEQMSEHEQQIRKEITEALTTGGIESALKAIAGSVKGPFSALAARLSEISFKSAHVKIEGTHTDATSERIFKLLRASKDYAAYNPASNTFYFRSDGVSNKAILHEAIHAATVSVLREYMEIPNGTTRTLARYVQEMNGNKWTAVAEKQYRRLYAAKRIADLYHYSKADYAAQFPTAYQNVYEFVAYAMTDVGFQKFLSRRKAPEGMVGYTSHIVKNNVEFSWKSMWRELTYALKDMFGLNAEQSDRNMLLELSEAFNDILKTPRKQTGMGKLMAMAGTVYKAPQTSTASVEEIQTRLADDLWDKNERRGKFKEALKNLFTNDGYETAVFRLQNKRRPIKTLEDDLAKSGRIIYAGEGTNAINTLLSLSSGKAGQYVTSFMQNPINRVHRGIEAFARAANIDIDQALARLHTGTMATHEQERRRSKYLDLVPLNNRKQFVIKLDKYPAKAMTAAEHRAFIDSELRSSRDLESEGKLDVYRHVLENVLVPHHIDVSFYGASLDDSIDPRSFTANINDRIYDVVGSYTAEQFAEMRNKFEEDRKNFPQIDEILSALEEIKKATMELDRKANYWSQPVTNIVKFRNWKNYVPFKGKPKKGGEPEVTAGDARYEIQGPRLSGDFIEVPYEYGGRMSDSDNPILQIMTDGIKSAMRAGREGVTDAIKNLINQEYIDGKVLSKTITFDKRYKGEHIEELRGPNKIFHYLPNGDIQILQINDKLMMEAIRQSWSPPQPWVDMMNRITSFIGHTHTRYNPAFHPYNFVRDILTNSFNVGAEFGMDVGQKIIDATSRKTVDGGMLKALKVSRLYQEQNTAELDRLKNSGDAFYRNIIEYLEEGGQIAFIQGLAIKGQFDDLMTDIGKHPVSQKREVLEKYLDLWANTFEYTSRAAAYGVMKEKFVTDGVEAHRKKTGRTPEKPQRDIIEESARRQAAAYVKNLANFEQVGTWGKTMGALYVFFRPAATGAVRAIDALAPLMQDVEKLISRLPESIQEDPEAVANYRANFAKAQDHARAMIMGLMGAGAVLYLMALAMSDDDEQGRNRVATDDMALWTRNLRLPLAPFGAKEGTYLQMPWGFGFGSFAAMGAQVAGTAFGKNTIPEMAVNAGNIALDSFVPVPFSRISALDNPLAWMLDSIFPSSLRPFLEFTMNTDGLGREIYNDRMSRYGDAFTGKTNVPEAYNGAARLMFKTTNGDVNVQPNTLYFWANNYFDGLSRIMHSGWGLGLSMAGEKNLDPKADFLLLSSFIGKKTNYDSRQFAAVEKKIKEKQALLKSLELQPEQYRRYLERHPNDPMIVEYYEFITNRKLNKLREYRKAIQSNPDSNWTPKDRKEWVDDLIVEENRIKRQLIDSVAAWGVKP